MRWSGSIGVTFSTKAGSVNLNTSIVQWLAHAGAAAVGVRTEAMLRKREPAPHGVVMTNAFPLLLSLVSVGVVTAALLPFDRSVALSLVPITYLIPIIVAATQWGTWPAILASVAATAAADFFFTPPVNSFRIDDPREAVDLALFLIVALVISNLASRLRRETQALRGRERQLQSLYEFSRLLAACFTVSDLISAIQKHLSRTLERQAVFFPVGTDRRLELPVPSSVPKAVQEKIASMYVALNMPSAAVVDEPTQHVWLLEAMFSDTAVHGIVAVNIGSGSGKAIDVRKRHAKTVLEEVSLTFQRLDIEKAIEDARLHLQAQLLRDAFHGTLSHELCTPLATIRGSASVLDSIPAVRDNRRMLSLVEAIADEAEELDGFIRNLLSATRVSAGNIVPVLEWTDPEDIIRAAIKRRAQRLAAHRIEIEFANELPLVRVDSGLMEEACGQLLENAAKYSPSGSTILVRIVDEQGRAVLSISDQGIGITPDEQKQIGSKSFRSPRHQATVPGSGLGFWIASIFVKANGGAIAISSRGHGQGTTASIMLPGVPTTPSGPAGLADE